MPFNLATAQPVAPQRVGFDLSTATPVSSSDLSDQIPGNQAVYEPKQPKPNFIEKKVGDLEALGSLGSSVVGGALGYAGGALGGIAGEIASGKLGTPEGGRLAEQAASEGANKLTLKPFSDEGKRRLEMIQKAIDDSKIMGLNPSEGIAMSSADVAPALRSLRGGVSKVAEGVGSVASKAGAAMKPVIDPDTLALAEKAKAFGIKVAPDMLSNNKFARIAGQASRDVPLSGSQTASNQVAFNKAIIKLIGGDENADKITAPVFSEAMKKSGGTIGSISEKHPIPLSGGLGDNLAAYAQKVSQFDTEEVGKIINSYIGEIRKAAGPDGVIDGQLFRKIRTQLTTQMRTTSSGDLRNALSELDDHMLDAVTKQLTPEELVQFADARKKYAIGKTVEPLVAKAAVKGNGDMSPAAFANQLVATKAGKNLIAHGRGGDAADLAAAGARFLTEPKSSFTTERGLVYGGLAGLAKVEPTTAGALWGGANAYNRFGSKLTDMMMSAQKKPPLPEVPGPAPLPEVPGAGPLIPGTDFNSLLKSTQPEATPLPQLPEAIQTSLEKQMGVPGSSLSLGTQEGKTPLPALPPQESGLLSLGGSAPTAKVASVVRSIEMKLRPEVINRVNELRKVYADETKPMAERLAATKELENLKGTYPGFVMDMENADATLKKLFESGKATQLPVGKTTGKGEVVSPAPKTEAKPAETKPVSNKLPEVPGASILLPGTNLKTLLQGAQPEATPLPELPPSVSSLKSMLDTAKPATEMPEAKPAPLPEPKVTSLLQAIRQKGGVDKNEIRDITGESRVGAGLKGLPPNTFKTEGKPLGDLANELRDEGWDIPDGVDGGVQALRDMIREELDGNKQYSIADTDRMTKYEYDKSMMEAGQEPVTEKDWTAMIGDADRAPPIMLDDWINFTEAQKDDELDKFFGKDTRPKPKGEEGR